MENLQISKMMNRCVTAASHQVEKVKFGKVLWHFLCVSRSHFNNVEVVSSLFCMRSMYKDFNLARRSLAGACSLLIAKILKAAIFLFTMINMIQSGSIFDSRCYGKYWSKEKQSLFFYGNISIERLVRAINAVVTIRKNAIECHSSCTCDDI